MSSPIDNPEEENLDAVGSPVENADLRPREAGASPLEADVWQMLAEVSQKLQMISASIKAAITSLLDTTIIWDRSTQHEFMVSINQSIDRSFPLLIAMTLAMKSEGGKLEWAREHNSIQEILTRVVDALERDGTVTEIDLSLPLEGKPALVDFDYLRIALTMLLEALLGASAKSPLSLHISAIEDLAHWQVQIGANFSDQAAELLNWLLAYHDQRPSFPDGILPEVMLKAFTAIRLLNLQGIELTAPHGIPAPASFTLIIPSIAK